MTDDKESPSGQTAAGPGTTAPLEPSSSRRTELGAAALTILFYALLVDAAVETFRSGSPVRWWVVIAVGGYLAASVSLWRARRSVWTRFGWERRATASFFLLLGLLALTAWLPGGLIDGVRLLRQPTSTVLSVVTVTAIVIAGMSVTRLPFLPVWGRWLAGALAVYGVAALLMGITTGASYPELLHGASVWSRLPFWLQGAFVGALVVVPIGLVARVARTLRFARGHEPATWEWRQVVALAMSLLMAISAFTGSGGLAIERSKAPGVIPVPSAAELKQSPTAPAPPPKPAPLDLAALATRAETIARNLPRQRYSLDAGAQALGGGAEAAFAFVRDHIRYEAYPGVLRGARGTYATRAGNAFDRSLLTAELLKRQGIPARFAMGRLPRPEAERLFARIFAAAPAPAKGGPGMPSALARPVDSIVARVRTRATRDYAAIRRALGGALPAGGGPSKDEVLAEIEGHAWVQAQVGGQWIDLDTAFADAVPGKAYCAAERVVDTLPAGARQLVTIRVIAETLEGASLHSDTAFTFSAPAEELIDRQIFLVHVPPGGGGLAGALASGSAPDTWVPTLWVDGQLHQGKPLRFLDEAQEAAKHGRPPAGGLGSLFGGGGALSSGRQLVAEWLEFEMAMPTGKRDVTRRALVDRAGVAWRSGPHDPATLRPLPRDANGVTIPRQVHNIWFSAGRHDLAAYADALRYLAQTLRNGNGAAPASDQPFERQLWPFAMHNFALLVVSDHVIVPSLNDSADVRFYADSPRVMIASAVPDPQRAGGTFTILDLRRDHLRGIARDPSASATVVERQIWFGALEGALEHETAARYVAAAGSSTTLFSTSNLLNDQGAQALTPADAARVSDVISNPETAARAARALSAGNLLVVPRPVLRGGMLGWWEIAPDGSTRAVLGDDLNMAGIRIPPPPWINNPARGPYTPPPPGSADLPSVPPGTKFPNVPGSPGRPPGTIPTNDPGLGELGGPKRPPQPYQPPEQIGPGNPLEPGGSGGGGGGGEGEAESNKKVKGPEYLMMIALITVAIIAVAVGIWIGQQPAVAALFDDVLEALRADGARE